MIKAIIFDYDGTLVDSDNIWFESCKKLCQEYGVIINEKDREDLMRGNLSAYLIEKYSLADPREIIKPKLAQIFEDLSRDKIKPLPGAIKIVERLSKIYLLAVASGTNTQRLSNSLKNLGIYQYFKVVIGVDLIQNSKPAPDTFLKAAELLQIDSKECLVIEDQPKGLEAAKAASMYCIIVPNIYLKNIDYSKADKVVNSLDLITEVLIREIHFNV